MYLPYDEELGIHPQDESFLDREPWDFESTPAENYPLLLHYHPLVIYRFQILKQADVVLAMYLRGQDFSREQKRRNFEYYDPITTIGRASCRKRVCQSFMITVVAVA